ncbi:serine/threonine-protein kinase [Streptomyces sp. NPDC002588]|uniref:serine/threonine-protein kinase n=1 Tax=Streptomyces sp. NPDC002588 TaxID=3154419 RepID=UPI00332B3B3B
MDQLPTVPATLPAPVTALTDADPAEAAGFRLLGRLGTGGFGHIYLGRRAVDHAVEPGGDPYVLAAVKLLKQEYSADPQHLQRFHQESKALERCAGARIPELLSFQFDVGRAPAIATRFIPGPSLFRIVDAQAGGLPSDSVRALGADLVDILRTAHSKRLLHRDLHPGNILLTADGPWIIDFGLTRISGQRLTRPLDQAIGNPHFCAPEQLEDFASTSAPTDVFGIGAVLLFALSGRVPYPGPRSAVRRSADLSGLAGDRLGEIVGACLAADAADRPTLEELRDELGDPGTPELPAAVHGTLDRHRAQLRHFLRSVGNEAELTVPFRPGRRRWSRNIGDWAHAVVASEDGAVAAADGAGGVHWLHAASGVPVARFPGYRPPLRMSAGERLFLVRDAAGRVEAWDTRERVRRWSAVAPGSAATPFLLHGHNVFLCESDATVLHFDVRTRRVWWRSGPLPGPTAIAAGPDRIYVLAGGGRLLLALHDEDGTPAWPEPVALEAPVRAAPLPVDDAVVVADTRGGLRCLSAPDAAVRWSVALGAPVVTAPVRVGDTVVVGDTSGVVHARAARTGAERWRTGRTDGDEIFALCALGGTLVAGGWLGRLHAVSAEDGGTVRTLDLPGQILALTPASLNTAVLAATSAGTVHQVPL